MATGQLYTTAPFITHQVLDSELLQVQCGRIQSPTVCQTPVQQCRAAQHAEVSQHRSKTDTGIAQVGTCPL